MLKRWSRQPTKIERAKSHKMAIMRHLTQVFHDSDNPSQ
jgi:hypothetical protein